jgi:hypothetical protein
VDHCDRHKKKEICLQDYNNRYTMMIAIMTLTELLSMLSIELQVNADPKTARYFNRSIEEETDCRNI